MNHCEIKFITDTVLNFSTVTQCIQRGNQQEYKGADRMRIGGDFSVILQHKISSSLEQNFIGRTVVRTELLDCILEQFMDSYGTQ